MEMVRSKPYERCGVVDGTLHRKDRENFMLRSDEKINKQAQWKAKVEEYGNNQVKI